MSNRSITIATGSTNPAKLRAVEQAAQSFFDTIDILPVSASVDIPDQPWGDEQTAHGALLRAVAARDQTNADIGIGIESGLQRGPFDSIYVVSWAVALDRDDQRGTGGSERFPLPDAISRELTPETELQPLIVRLYPELADRARAEGIVSLLTENRRSRTDILTLAVLHALSSLFNFRDRD